MPIITSTILRKDGTPFVGFVQFTPWWSTPPSSVDDMQPLNSVTSKTGQLSQRVKAGYYRVAVGLNPAVMILVPDNVADDAQLELTTTIVGPNYAPSSSGGGGNFTVYYGKSNTLVLTGQQVFDNLTSKATGTIASTYSFPSGLGYMFFCFPDSAGSPAAGSGFIAGAFAIGMAGSAQGFDQEQNGFSYKLVTVSGVQCRLYRSFYATNGSAEITVNK
jgi:hypothetical protein